MYENSDEYVNIETMCSLLSCCRTTAYRLLKADSRPLKHYRLGRHYKVRLKDIYEFMDNQADTGKQIRIER